MPAGKPRLVLVFPTQLFRVRPDVALVAVEFELEQLGAVAREQKALLIHLRNREMIKKR